MSGFSLNVMLESINARQDEFRLFQAAFLWKVWGLDHVCSERSANKKNINTGYKGTKHIEQAFLISDYY